MNFRLPDFVFRKKKHCWGHRMRGHYQQRHTAHLFTRRSHPRTQRQAGKQTDRHIGVCDKFENKMTASLTLVTLICNLNHFLNKSWGISWKGCLNVKLPADETLASRTSQTTPAESTDHQNTASRNSDVSRAV